MSERETHEFVASLGVNPHRCLHCGNTLSDGNHGISPQAHEFVATTSASNADKYYILEHSNPRVEYRFWNRERAAWMCLRSDATLYTAAERNASNLAGVWVEVPVPDSLAPEHMKLWVCSKCLSPRLYGSSAECKVCGTLLHDTAEYARVDTRTPVSPEVEGFEKATPRPWRHAGAIVYADSVMPKHKMFTEQPAIAACSPQAAKTAGFIDDLRYEVSGANAIYEANAELIVRAVNAYGARVSPSQSETIEALVKAMEASLGLLAAEAEQLESWAIESRAGGWSTHQIEPMNRQAAMLRESESRLRAALRAALALAKKESGK